MKGASRRMTDKNSMIEEARSFVKVHFNDIMLFIIVTLLILLAFATGYITAKYQSKEPIQITNQNKI
jgi:hypothetical protein